MRISYLLEWFCKGGSFHISSCMHTLMQIYQNIFMFPTRTQARAVMIKNIILNRTLLMHNPNKTKCFATLIVYYTSNIQKQKLGGARGAREVLSSVAPTAPFAQLPMLFAYKLCSSLRPDSPGHVSPLDPRQSQTSLPVQNQTNSRLDPLWPAHFYFWNLCGLCRVWKNFLILLYADMQGH